MTDTTGAVQSGPDGDLLRDTAKAVWWMALLRAVLIIAFGVVALAWPGMALLGLVFVFGFYAILDGVTAIVIGVRSRAGDRSWGWTVAQGVVSVLAGIVALVWPGVTALGLLFVIAAWAVVRGIATIAEAVRTRGANDRWGWALAAGVLDVLFGIVLLVWPAAGILTLLWLVGVFSIIAGIVLLVLAFRIRRLART